MTRHQKEALAYALLGQAGDLIEFWHDYLRSGKLPDNLAGVDVEEAAEQLTQWLKRLPGDIWDNRLPLPQN